jgi:hypothetical protein
VAIKGSIFTGRSAPSAAHASEVAKPRKTRASVVTQPRSAPIHWRDSLSRRLSLEEAQAEPPCQRLFPEECPPGCSRCAGT